MAKQQGNFLTAIDVGSAKTCVLMAEVTDNGLRYRGHGLAESRGSRKGVIVDLDKAVAAIQKAAEAAEDVAGASVEHALVGVGGAHIRGVNSHGGISLGTRPREIGRDEIKQAVARARAIPLPADREILHLLPQEFILDDQAGVHDPLGMMAARLEVRVHMVTAAASATQRIPTMAVTLKRTMSRVFSVRSTAMPLMVPHGAATPPIDPRGGPPAHTTPA